MVLGGKCANQCSNNLQKINNTIDNFYPTKPFFFKSNKYEQLKKEDERKIQELKRKNKFEAELSKQRTEYETEMSRLRVQNRLREIETQKLILKNKKYNKY